jgi:hypothetical protein
MADERLAGGGRLTLGGDKGYDTRAFVACCRQLKVTPHLTQMKVEVAGHRVVNGLKKLPKFNGSVPMMELTEHSAGLEIERGKQGGGAVTPVVVGATFGLPGAHGQQRLTAVERLNLRLLINTQNQRLVRRVQIQTDNVAHLFDKQRVFRELEALDPVRLQAEGAPDAADHTLAQPATFGHRTRAPMRRIRGSGFEGQPDHSFNLCVGHLAWRSRPRFIQQSIQPPLHKPLAPFAHRLLGYPQMACHQGVGLSRRAFQNQPRPLGERRFGPARPFF